MSEPSESYEAAPPEPSKSDPEYYIPMQEAAELSETAGELETHAMLIAGHNGDLFILVESLAEVSWKGNRAKKFAHEWGKVHEDVSRWVRNIERTAGRLREEAADLQRQAENYLGGG